MYTQVYIADWLCRHRWDVSQFREFWTLEELKEPQIELNIQYSEAKKLTESKEPKELTQPKELMEPKELTELN